MNFCGLDFTVHSLPKNDPGFIPLAAFARRHQQVATQAFAVAYQRAEDDISVYETKIIGTPEYRQADMYYLERLLLSLEKAWGGHTLYLCGDADLAEAIAEKFREGGEYADPPLHIRIVYGRNFSVVVLPYDKRPASCEVSLPYGGNTKGFRIGFDAGGSDIKVSAVIDGKPVFSEEREWIAKKKSNIDYHYGYVVKALKDAAAHLPQVDAVGVSGPGLFAANNEVIYCSIYKSLSPEVCAKEGRTLFIDAVKELGHDIPLVAIGDGEVAAIAGAMQLGGATRVLGIPLGTNVGGGYVDKNGNLTNLRATIGCIPIDCQEGAPMDEFAKVIGCSGIYLGQDGVLRIAEELGIEMKGETLAMRLKEVQALANSGEEKALSIFHDVGVYLGHAIAWYNQFYDIAHVVIMGRVCSGRGGELLFDTAKATLASDWPECSFSFNMPDEMTRRLGQSVAAASL